VDLADSGAATASAVPRLQELEASTRRAAALYRRMKRFTAP
jgi:hypothetical protein